MEKFFEIRFPLESDYEKLKNLWNTSFDDTVESLNYFFKNTVSPDRVLAVFDGEIAVSALYMLESAIVIDKKEYSAYYVYAVCTHPGYRGKGLMKSLFEELFKTAKDRLIDYIFLVPEEEYLFEIYKKIGFKIGFSYSEKIVFKKDSINERKNKIQKLTYRDYRKLLFENPVSVPLAVLKESTFKSFFSSVSGEVKTVFIKNEGYALYEETEEKLTVYELYGNVEKLLNAVFQSTEKNTLIYRQTANENPVPYGMYYKIGSVPEIRNGFFGIPYAN